MKIKYLTIVFLMFFFLMTGCGSNDSVLISDNSTEVLSAADDYTSEVIDADTTQSTAENSKIKEETYNVTDNNDLYVFVCGHVKNPGVYKLEYGSRVCDSIEAAGGITSDGQPAALDQAKILIDEQTVYVPGIDEEWSRTSGDGTSADDSSKGDSLINLNMATREELLTLPGIGESKADDIIRYRDEHGRFEAVEDIMNIQGIKEGIFNKIKDRISI